MKFQNLGLLANLTGYSFLPFLFFDYRFAGKQQHSVFQECYLNNPVNIGSISI